MLKFLKYLKPIEWLWMVFCAGLIVLQVWLDLKLPDYMQEITRLVTQEGSDMGAIWTNGGFMLLCAFASFVSAVIVCFFASKISSALAMRIRASVFGKVESFSTAETKKFTTASLITRTTNDVVQLQLFYAMAIQLVIKAPVMGIWAVCKIAGKGWEWSVSTAGSVFLIIVLLLVILLFALPKFKRVQKLTDKLNAVTKENLEGIRVVRAYNAENYEKEKFEKANKNLTDTQLSINRAMAMLLPGMTLILNGLTLSIYWIGAFLIAGAATPIVQLDIFSNMIVYTQYAMQVVIAFMLLILIFMLMPRATVSAKRVHEVLNTKPSIIDGTIESVKNKNATIEFKNVGFKYPDAENYVLKNVNFSASKGETVAFIGSTGSGKSTLANLVARLYDATEGEVLIDGQNIKDLTLKSLHDKIGFVTQKAFLFQGTIDENLKFGADIGQEQVETALSTSQAKEFVENLEEKQNSPVAQMGSNFSGGQKQRLSIARALAKNPEILIFDDSFSALDYKTDKTLRKAIRKNFKNTTTLIVAQRIGTILDADKILVLDEGNIVGVGKHKELLQTCEVYKEIALSQLSKEELANA